MKKKTQLKRTVATARWGQERRLEFIDFRLRWDRTVNRGELVEHFRISTQQASADLSMYSKLAPKNLEYDKNLKTYRATANFKPAVACDDAQVFLDQLAAVSTGTLLPSVSLLGWRPPHDIVRFPARPIATGTLLRLLWAIRDGEEIEVVYQSMRRPAPTSRWIAPHALAYDGLRWHVRAWCHENVDFRDFVISRIQSVQASRKTTVAANADTWWHTFVDVVVKPRAGLTEAQRSAIEIDFGMTARRLKLNCRKALAFYLLRQLQLDRPTELPPAAQPLELMNRDELSDVIAAARKVPQCTSHSTS
ncbi:MAG: helix-turn-helix transcriptional regulator [Acidiferrobacterales bacterium]